VNDSEVRARDAAALKENPLLTEILDQVKQEAINAWIGTGPDDKDKREMAWTLVKAQGRIRDVIQGAIDDGLISASRAAREPLR